jgi:hypothetical protein
MQFNGEFSWTRASRSRNCGKRIFDTVSAGKTLDFGKLNFGGLDFGRPDRGKLGFSENVVQTNIAVEVAVAIGGMVAQVIDQSNVV